MPSGATFCHIFKQNTLYLYLHDRILVHVRSCNVSLQIIVNKSLDHLEHKNKLKFRIVGACEENLGNDKAWNGIKFIFSLANVSNILAPGRISH